MYFGVDRSQTTDNSYIFSDLESDLAKRELCNDIIKVQDYNERVTNFMLDLYRSALRYFSLAMLFIMILGIGNIIFTDSSWINNKDKIQAFFKQEVSDTKKSLNGNATDVDIAPEARSIPFVDASSKILKTAPSSETQAQPNL